MKEEVRTQNPLSLSENFASTAQRVITVDVALYEKYLRDADMSPEQKEEFLDAMFSILIAFVELGLRVHPLQQVVGQEPCGQDEKACDQGPKDASDRVRSKAMSKMEPKSRTGPEGRLEV